MKRTSLALLVLATLLLSACSGAPTAPESPPTGVQEPAQPSGQPSGEEQGTAPGDAQSGTSAAPLILQPAEVDPPVVLLLPGDGAQHRFSLSDGSVALEGYVRDGARLIAAYNGEPWVTWFITDQGIFRRDPKGPGLLLYLPAEPEDGLAWKQRSGDADVWFNLQAVPDCLSPLGPTYEICWQLTVLNRQEQTVYLFAPGPATEDWLGDTTGVQEARADNFASPADSFVKRRQPQQPLEPPSREAMLAGAEPWPTDEAAPVERVTLADFRSEQLRQAAEAGFPVKEVDLNGDGETEAIIGQLGAWHNSWVLILDARGNRLQVQQDWMPDDVQRRVDLVTIPGLANPVVVTHTGSPDGWHSMRFEWMEGDRFVSPWGWHPKTDLAFGMDYAILPDGTVEISGSLSGYTFVSRYVVERVEEGVFPYEATKVEERVTPGPYPTTAADLMTDLFLARWYGLTDMVEQYVPDPAVRDAFMAVDVGKVRYAPSPVRVGKRVETEYGPTVEPGPPNPDGSFEFLASVQEYEGGFYWIGRAVVGAAEDGRLVVKSLEFLEQGWAY
ncbi:MAG: hypothetical protein AB2385_13840 [Symbiobacterium sp.]|uniref:hypothetical protein n=1 Tax=Symbiobacterium sp. TaxID=1971213 RepID=UPI00346487B1